MPRFAANLTMMFTELPFPERFAAAARAGFPAVEFLFPYDYPVADVTRWLKDAGLISALFNLPPGDWATGERGIASIPGREAEFQAGVDLALEYALAMGTSGIHAMAGLLPAGADRARHRAVFVDNLRHAAKALAGQGLTLLIEPINTRDMPGYFLDDFDVARAIIEDLALPNLKLQFDIYHRQILHGDVTIALREMFPRIGHIQIASVPARNEPMAGELNDVFLFAELDRLGYDGFVGCEYRPAGKTEAGLGWFAPWRV